MKQFFAHIFGEKPAGSQPALPPGLTALLWEELRQARGPTPRQASLFLNETALVPQAAAGGYIREAPAVTAAHLKRTRRAAIALLDALSSMSDQARAAFYAGELQLVRNGAETLREGVDLALASCSSSRQLKPSAVNAELLIGRLVIAYYSIVGAWPPYSKESWFPRYVGILVDHCAPSMFGEGSRAKRSRPACGPTVVERVVKALKAARQGQPTRE